MFPVRVGAHVLALVAAAAASVQEPQHQHPAGEKLGTVHFQTSCTAPAQAPFDRAMALLHSFEFGPAIEGFNAAAKDGPGVRDGALGHRDRALDQSVRRDDSSARTDAAGSRRRSRRRGRPAPKTERERAYIEAAAKLYADAGTLDQRARVVAYEKAMARAGGQRIRTTARRRSSGRCR